MSSPDRMAASRVRISPIGTISMSDGFHPLETAMLRASQSVSDPAVETPMRFPLRPAMLVTPLPLATTSAMFAGRLATAATA